MLPAAKNKYDIHEDFDVKLTPTSSPLSIRVGSALATIVTLLIKPKDGFNYRKTKIKSFDGTKIGIKVFWPDEIQRPSPCILYFHGGGFVLGSNPIQEKLIMGFKTKVPFRLISVDYRLALDHPFPTGVEDCYAFLVWVAKNSRKLGVDRNKIVVYGESAGGALAAAVTQMARDRKGPKICLQMLLYPVLDCSMTTESSYTFTDTPVWNTGANKKMWEYYLRDWEKPISPYASPMHAETLKNLPPAYIETAEFDPLRDEGIAYAARLKADGVEVTLNKTKRTVHGYDLIKVNEIVKKSIRKRVCVLNQVFLK